MHLTPHFTLREFRCHDGTEAPSRLWPSLRKLAENLEVLRAAVGGRRIHVNSGYRTPTYNKRVGGARLSTHLYGRAADIAVEGMTAAEVADKIEELIRAGKMHNGGLGRYATFTHYDVRLKPARWRG